MVRGINPGSGQVVANPEITVRREKALDHSGCKSHPGTGSLHPVAIEAAEETTNLLEPSV
jgi:hypothetical protein